MFTLLAGLAAFSLGGHLRARNRIRMQPQGRQARQVNAVAGVNRSKNGSMGQALAFPSLSQTTLPDSLDCRCR